MKLTKLSSRIRYMPPEPETDRPTIAHVRGDRFSLAIDAGNSAAHVDQFRGALRAGGLREPSFVALTHWHWDHTFGMHAVKGVTIAGRRTAAHLADVARWGWSDGEMAARLADGTEIESCDRDIRLEYPDRSLIKVVPPGIVFQDSLSIDLGGVHCVLMEILAPHSDDNVLIYVPEERTVFLGDADGGDYYGADGRYDRTRLLSLVATLEDLDFETCVPGHDVPISKAEQLAYLQEALESIE